MAAHHFDPSAGGYHAVYREGQVNYCPGCSRTHWIIGRVTAECAFCSTALPLGDGCNQRDEDPGIITQGKGGGHVR